MAQLKLGNLEIRNIVDKVDVKTDSDYSKSKYIGKVGSTSNFISETGKVITFENICANYEESTQGNNSRFEDYSNLATQYKKKEGTLVSESDAKLDGKYKVTNFEYEEDTNHNFTIKWELTEEVTFNQTKKTFRTFGKKKSTKKKKTTKANSKVNSTSKYLLKKCGVLSTKKGGAKCVKTLQKFLQSQASANKVQNQSHKSQQGRVGQENKGILQKEVQNQLEGDVFGNRHTILQPLNSSWRSHIHKHPLLRCKHRLE